MIRRILLPAAVGEEAVEAEVPPSRELLLPAAQIQLWQARSPVHGVKMTRENGVFPETADPMPTNGPTSITHTPSRDKAAPTGSILAGTAL